MGVAQQFCFGEDHVLGLPFAQYGRSLITDTLAECEGGFNGGQEGLE
jgi:hypothetical protein